MTVSTNIFMAYTCIYYYTWNSKEQCLTLLWRVESVPYLEWIGGREVFPADCPGSGHTDLSPPPIDEHYSHHHLQRNTGQHWIDSLSLSLSLPVHQSTHTMQYTVKRQTYAWDLWIMRVKCRSQCIENNKFIKRPVLMNSHKFVTCIKISLYSLHTWCYPLSQWFNADTPHKTSMTFVNLEKGREHKINDWNNN